MSDGKQNSLDSSFDCCSFMSFQVKEIEKHKYIESEKAGRDLDQEAVKDWIRKYAKEVRDWAEKSGLFTRTSAGTP